MLSIACIDCELKINRTSSRVLKHAKAQPNLNNQKPNPVRTKPTVGVLGGVMLALLVRTLQRDPDA
jgi:hypothetical protein